LCAGSVASQALNAGRGEPGVERSRVADADHEGLEVCPVCLGAVSGSLGERHRRDGAPLGSRVARVRGENSDERQEHRLEDREPTITVVGLGGNVLVVLGDLLADFD
jgi:hypothetical protein